MVLVLTQENPFLQGFYFKTNGKTLKVPLKNGTRVFLNIPSFKTTASFSVKITGDFESFRYFNFETSFLKKQNFF